MADGVETLWQDVHEEAANELVGMERREFITLLGSATEPLNCGASMYWS